MSAPAIRSGTALYGLLAIFLLLLSGYAMVSGPVDSSLPAVIQALFANSGDAADQRLSLTFWHLRLPRVAMGLLAGSALAVAGVVMQALFRNPLAEPGLTGSAAGAALAASMVIVLGGMQAHPMLLPLAAFCGALVATVVVLLMPGTDGHQGIASLLLLGIAINAICAAGLGFLSFLADDFALRSLTFWQFGSLGKASWPELGWASLMSLPALLWLLCQWRALNSLLLGEAEAYHLGLDVQRFKIRALLACAVCVGAAVACAGIIAFVGLVVPHLLRTMVGPDHRRLLIGSALAAPCLLIAADTAARTLVSPAELPVGILTSLLGGPFFIYLLLRRSREVLR